MTAVNMCIHFLWVVIAFTEVAGWTYDLEEVRRFFDEQQKKEENWKEHLKSENKNETLVENSTYNYGDQRSRENDDREYNGDDGNFYHRHGDGDSYHNSASHENGGSYHNQGSHENTDNYPHHRSNNYPRYYGSPGHMGSYNGLYNVHSLKPYKGESRKYADGYGYESYMGLKLHGIMHNGTKYLEGLRLAIENFKSMVENCSTSNVTPFPGLRYNGTAPGMELFSPSSVQGLGANMPWPQIFNTTAAMMGVNTSNPLQRARDAVPGAQSFSTSRCANATRDKEHLRRLADLAMHTVRQLQDLAMKKRHKDHKHEEIELLMRLAWFLERIAHITGFDPDAESFTPTESSQPATTASTQYPLTLNVSEAVKQRMMDCVHANSTVPATLRCNIPVDIPPIMRMTFNIPENNNDSPVLANPAPEPAGGPVSQDPAMIGNPMSDLMSNPEFNPGPLGGLIGEDISSLPPFPGSPPDLPPLSVLGLPDANPSGPPPSDAVQMAAVDQMSNLAPFPRAARSVRKRSIEDPMLKVIKYYVKHKVWAGSNTEAGESGVEDDLGVDNGISTPKSIQKRSANKYMKAHRHRVNNHIRNKRSRHALKSFKKRSVKYQDWVVSRLSEDPQQDISYYVKNKPGTNMAPSLLGVAQARLALERIFQTGNMEVVRRYGANYNPAIPSPFYFGIVKTLSDI